LNKIPSPALKFELYEFTFASVFQGEDSEVPELESLPVELEM
jgi:hypothetical protein